MTLNSAKALQQLKVLDTSPEEMFDRITQLASSICGTPISLITFLDEAGDRQFHKSRLGFDPIQIPLSQSFCAHACASHEPVMIVENALEDERFKNNPLVTEQGVRFYAGVPLYVKSEDSFGALCILDKKAKALDLQQIEMLKLLANQAEDLLNARSVILAQKEQASRLSALNKELKEFSSIVAHDLKSPLGNLSVLVELLERKLVFKGDADAIRYLKMMDDSINAQREMIDGALEVRRQTGLLEERANWFKGEDLINYIKDSFSIEGERIIATGEDINLFTRQESIRQCVQNLVSNALKYSPSDKPVFVSIEQDGGQYKICVRDEGQGIPDDAQHVIFRLFENLGRTDTNGNKGTGLGLAVVKQIMDGLNGKIVVDSVEGAYTSFTLLFDEILYD